MKRALACRKNRPMQSWDSQGSDKVLSQAFVVSTNAPTPYPTPSPGPAPPMVPGRSQLMQATSIMLSLRPSVAATWTQASAMMCWRGQATWWDGLRANEELRFTLVHTSYSRAGLWTSVCSWDPEVYAWMRCVVCWSVALRPCHLPYRPELDLASSDCRRHLPRLITSPVMNPNVVPPAATLRLEKTSSGAGAVGWANRGIGGQGLALQTLDYEGYAVASAPSTCGTRLCARRPRQQRHAGISHRCRWPPPTRGRRSTSRVLRRLSPRSVQASRGERPYCRLRQPAQRGHESRHSVRAVLGPVLRRARLGGLCGPHWLRHSATRSLGPLRRPTRATVCD